MVEESTLDKVIELATDDFLNDQLSCIEINLIDDDGEVAASRDVYYGDKIYAALLELLRRYDNHIKEQIDELMLHRLEQCPEDFDPYYRRVERRRGY